MTRLRRQGAGATHDVHDMHDVVMNHVVDEHTADLQRTILDGTTGYGPFGEGYGDASGRGCRHRCGRGDQRVLPQFRQPLTNGDQPLRPSR